MGPRVVFIFRAALCSWSSFSFFFVLLQVPLLLEVSRLLHFGVELLWRFMVMFSVDWELPEVSPRVIFILRLSFCSLFCFLLFLGPRWVCSGPWCVHGCAGAAQYVGSSQVVCCAFT